MINECRHNTHIFLFYTNKKVSNLYWINYKHSIKFILNTERLVDHKRLKNEVFMVRIAKETRELCLEPTCSSICVFLLFFSIIIINS